MLERRGARASKMAEAAPAGVDAWKEMRHAAMRRYASTVVIAGEDQFSLSHRVPHCCRLKHVHLAPQTNVLHKHTAW